MLVDLIRDVADVAISCVSTVASRIGMHSRELRSTRLYIAQVSILTSRFKFLSVKMHLSYKLTWAIFSCQKPDCTKTMILCFVEMILSFTPST